MKYHITIMTKEPYEAKETQYEGTDGKVYASQYGLPEGVKVGKVSVPTGETKYTEAEIYSQEVESLDLEAVIKAVNKI
jgi:hypothetical protein